MHINLPDKTREVLAPLNDEQKGLIFSALMSYANNEDTTSDEKMMDPEARMAFAFITMWNNARKEQFQARRVKYNQENRSET